MSMDVAIELLVAWAMGRSRRAGSEINGLVGTGLDAAVDRVWQVVRDRPDIEPAVRRIVTEARDTGDASTQARAEATTALRRAAERDPEFAARLNSAMSPDAQGPSIDSHGLLSGNIITARGSVRLTSKNKIANYARRNPLVSGVVIIIIVAAVAWVLSAVIDNAKGNNGVSGDPATAMMGTWTASDGSGTKTFSASGECEGYYYNGGEPLDIGGPMTCTLSSSSDPEGRFTLTVSQSPNQASYKVKLETTHQVVIYTTGGRELYRLRRD